MITTHPRYSKEEMAQRGDAIYEREVLSRISPDDEGKFAAIDVETGAFEVDANELGASDRLRSRIPDAQIWMRQIGTRYLHRFGLHPRSVKS